MAFSLGMGGVRRVTSYAEALAAYEKGKPRRSASSGVGERSVPGKSSKVTGITLRSHNQAVEFIYHRTEVVTWYPDNTCVLDLSYRSQSTTTFANSFTPLDISVLGESEVLRVGPWVGGKFYAAGRIVTIKPDGTLEGNRTLTLSKIDRKAANAALREANFPAFYEFYKPLADFWGRELHTGSGGMTSYGLLERMKNPSEFDDLARTTYFGMRCEPAMFLGKLRNLIYQEAEAYTERQETVADNYNTMRKWLREANN